ncbi:MAG: phospholipase D-like domain-containing protein [Ilumatobacteraceae bacterium]
MSESEQRSGHIRRAMVAINGVPTTSGNRLELLRNGEQIFPAMLAAIDDADRSIDLLTFVYWSGDIGAQFADAIARAGQRGVRVRVLLDALGAKPVDAQLVEQMRDAGAIVRFFRPPDPRHPLRVNHRTHRKVMVCDEAVAFTGGVGIADEWMGDGQTGWRDTHVRVTGPAVNGLRAAFLDNWIETDPSMFDDEVDRFPELDCPGSVDVQVILGTAEPGWNAISMTVRALVDMAVERVRITTAYFVPDDDLAGRLVSAAERGVTVEILLPGPGADKRFVQLAGEERYTELLEHGIEIWNYGPSMLHAKLMTIDGSVGVIGSANFNHRSTSLDDEVNLVAFDEAFARSLDDDFDDDLGRSEAIEPSRWKRRSWPQRTLEQAVHLVRPWL